MERKPYTQKEKKLLVELVKMHVDVVENKQTNGVSLGDKQNAWKQIRNAFNAQPEIETKRDEKQLKKLWDNLKQQKRRQNTEIKQDMLQTGGGPPLNNPQDELMEIVEATVPNLEVEINCPWDSTSIYRKNNNEDNHALSDQSEGNIEKRSMQQNEHPLMAANRKRDNVRFIKKVKGQDQEKALRLKKLEESISQQRELPEIKKDIAYQEQQQQKLLHEIQLETANVELTYKKKLLENIKKFQ